MAITTTFKSAIFSTTAATSYAGTTNWTPGNKSLIVAFVANSLAATPLDPTSVTGHGLTFTQITLASRLISTTHTVSVWVADSGFGATSGAASASYGAVSQTGGVVIEFEVTGADVLGTAVQAVVQQPVGTGTTGTTGTVTLSAASWTGNMPLSFFVHLANEGTTPRTNWTETSGADGNFNTPATGAEAQFRNDAFETTATATWTTSIHWRGVALEIKMALPPVPYNKPISQGIARASYR